MQILPRSSENNQESWYAGKPYNHPVMWGPEHSRGLKLVITVSVEVQAPGSRSNIKTVFPDAWFPCQSLDGFETVLSITWWYLCWLQDCLFILRRSPDAAISTSGTSLITAFYILSSKRLGYHWWRSAFNQTFLIMFSEVLRYIAAF